MGDRGPFERAEKTRQKVVARLDGDGDNCERNSIRSRRDNDLTGRKDNSPDGNFIPERVVHQANC